MITRGDLVASISATPDAILPPALLSCMAKAIHGVTFPPSIAIQVPLRFQPTPDINRPWEP